MFLKRDGTGPRTEIRTMVKRVLRLYGKTPICPHVFRALQVVAHSLRVVTASLYLLLKATESERAGANSQEHKAMSMGRNHDPSTAARYYQRISLERYQLGFVMTRACRSADLAASHCASLRQKRKAENGVEDPDVAPVKRCKHEPAKSEWETAEVID